MKLILASASPRRRELLERYHTELNIDPSPGPDVPPERPGPAEIVKALSAAKAADVAARHPGELVIGADTIVELDGVILGKPVDRDDAFRMLRMLSGREHRVYTGVTIFRDDLLSSEAEATRVFFREMTDEQINAYIDTGEPMDKAGAYGCQGAASLFIEKIEGDFFNVMGLPLCHLGQMLERLGASLL